MAHAVSTDRWQTMSYGFELHGNFAQIAANRGRLYIVVDVEDAVVGTMYIYGYRDSTRQWERVDRNNASRFMTVDSNGCQDHAWGGLGFNILQHVSGPPCRPESRS